MCLALGGVDAQTGGDEDDNAGGANAQTNIILIVAGVAAGLCLLLMIGK